jgi:hypothetical protein
VNGGGDDDFLTTTIDNDNVDNNNSRKKISMPTDNAQNHTAIDGTFKSISMCIWDSASVSKLQEHVHAEVALGSTLARSVGTSSGSLCMRISASTAATTVGRRPTFARAHAHHINNHHSKSQ